MALVIDRRRVPLVSFGQPMKGHRQSNIVRGNWRVFYFSRQLRALC